MQQKYNALPAKLISHYKDYYHFNKTLLQSKSTNVHAVFLLNYNFEKKIICPLDNLHSIEEKIVKRKKISDIA